MHDFVAGLPPNWEVVFGEMIHECGISPREIDEMEVADVMWWHQTIVKSIPPPSPRRRRR